MSRQADGSYRCARCGADVGGGGVATSVVIATLDPDTPGTVLTLNICRDRTEDGQTVAGCERVVLAPDNLAYYLQGDTSG